MSAPLRYEANGPVGNFINPFSQDAFRDLTGLQSFGGFSGTEYNPYLAKKTPVQQDVREQRAQNRAIRIAGQFSNPTFPADAYGKPQVNLTYAMTNLAESIFDITGSTCMWDSNGYLAYPIKSKNAQATSYSTNLSRLRKAFMKGREAAQADGGPVILGAPANPTVESQASATNRMWGVVISWHKLVNAARGYNENYRNRGVTGNFNNFQVRKARNLTNKFYYYASNPEEYGKYVTKANMSIKNYGARYGQRLANIDAVIKGIISPSDAAFRQMDQEGTVGSASIGARSVVGGDDDDNLFFEENKGPEQVVIVPPPAGDIFQIPMSKDERQGRNKSRGGGRNRQSSDSADRVAEKGESTFRRNPGASVKPGRSNTPKKLMTIADLGFTPTLKPIKGGKKTGQF